VVQTLPPGDKAVVVASDKDLWQLLEGDRVVQYDPRKGEVFGAASLFSEYGITPAQWVYVKALAGCSGDNVKGVKGVGEITAARYLKGQLTKGVKYSAIKAAENPFGILNKNLQLVRLPYPGCPQFQLKSDTVTTDKWQAVCNRLGLKTLRDKLPVVEY
jgi:5'-3' exonuclease